jgi:hypothetical protein
MPCEFMKDLISQGKNVFGGEKKTTELSTMLD